MQIGDSILTNTLHEFRVRANESARVQSLIRGWEPTIVVEATDSGETRFLTLRGGQIASVSAQADKAVHTVHLRSPEAVLVSIFNGQSNPAEAFLNGELEIFASDKDQVKLDAISLVLWGM